MPDMTTAPAQARLPAALRVLRDRVDGLRFGLRTAESEAATRSARAVVDQVDDYLLPRLESLDAPLLAVVGGSTGAGKSTLVNSLVRKDVTTAGVLRPTTRAPVLVCNAGDVAWFQGERVLPGMPRSTGADAGGLQLVPLADLPAGLALLDAPDVDSVVESNRDLAGQLLSAADLWLFVTTAARYADAVPWDLLRTAQERATALAIVLDRVPPEAVAEVAADLRAMLVRAGLTSARLFVIEERPLVAGRLPEDQVAPVRDWLHALASDEQERATVVRQTLAGALDSLDGRVTTLVGALEQQAVAAKVLREAAISAYDGARDQVDDGVQSGTLLRGEVLARWQDFVGTGELLRNLESKVGQLRDKLTAAFTGRPTPEAEVAGALESSVEQLLRAAADRAAERTVTAWRGSVGGPDVLATAADRTLDKASAGFGEAAAREVRDWQGAVLDLVRSEGADKRTTARFLSFGVNGAGLVVMIAVFAQTGGLTGAEIAISGGTSALGQKLLEAVFGDAAVRSLAEKARRDLDDRVDRLFDAEQERFTALVESAAPAGGTVESLTGSLKALTAARKVESTGAPDISGARA